MLFVFKRIILEERLYYDQKGGRALRIVVASAETLFAPLNCLPLLRFCLSSFFPPVLLFPLFLSFFPHIFPPHFFSFFFPLWHCSYYWTAFPFLNFAFPPLFSSFFYRFSIRVAKSGIFAPHFFPLFFPLWLWSRHWTAFLFLNFAFPLFPLISSYPVPVFLSWSLWVLIPLLLYQCH